MGIFGDIWQTMLGCPKDEEREEKYHKYLKEVGWGYKGKHYEERPAKNVQYEQLGDNGEVFWLNDED